MGHLSIVTNNSFSEILREGCVSVKANLGKYAHKTIADVFSDCLATRINDPIFPWFVKDSTGPNDILGFKYELTVAEKPIYVKNDPLPLKIPIKTTIIEYPNMVSEDIALNLFCGDLLWNAIGKKSLGRGRALTHQTPFEDQILRNYLGIGSLRDYSFNRKQGIEITMNPGAYNQNHIEEVILTSLSNIELRNLHFYNGDTVTYEKVLEAWLMENLFDNFYIIFQIDCNVLWIGNYSPYGVLGKNIDIIALVEKNSQRYAFVIELKRDSINDDYFQTTYEQVVDYCIFSEMAFNLRKENIFPVIIGKLAQGYLPLEHIWPNKPLQIDYKVDQASIKFTHKDEIALQNLIKIFA
ncbi:MAG: hypothetical protein PHW02_04350 [bacterium]|nr:hypothetical protein [bacterium]